MEEILDTVKQYVEMYWKWIIAGIVLLILMISVFIKPSESESKENETNSMYQEILNETDNTADGIESETIEQKGSEETQTEIFVDVKGAVQHPGVYEMADGSRLIDAIEKAGGFTKEADSNTVNLAQLLTDQMMIYVGKVGEEPLPINQSGEEQVNEENGENLSININTAEFTELMKLKGIGEAKAQNIITYREENGKFETIEEIKEVSGIGEGIFEGLKGDIVVH